MKAGDERQKVKTFYTVIEKKNKNRQLFSQGYEYLPLERWERGGGPSFPTLSFARSPSPLSVSEHHLLLLFLSGFLLAFSFS